MTSPSNIDKLHSAFAIPGAAAVVAGNGDLPKVVLTHESGARAEVYLHGAHVASWVTARGEQFLLSRASAFTPARPIRGGIPVIFPQFGGGPLPQHGFARISDWALRRTSLAADGEVSAALQLTDSPATRAVWPYAFALELDVRLAADTLAVRLRACNTGAEPFTFQAVLHTYFAVADIARTALHGLAGVTFLDSLRDDLRAVETRAEIRFAEETDRVYLAAPDTLRLADEGHHRSLTITKTAMPDVVVWNPWIAKAQRMPDFGDEEYRTMLCVETGVIDPPHLLPAGAEWVGETVFTSRNRA